MARYVTVANSRFMASSLQVGVFEVVANTLAKSGNGGSAGLNRLGRRAPVLIAELLGMKADQTEPEKGPV